MKRSPQVAASRDAVVASGYRGRLAPSPTGLLHLGHARTFWVAQQRARLQDGKLVLRNEDLDRARCKPEFVSQMIEDLVWFGFQWDEGPDCGGSFGPYSQSKRRAQHVEAFERLYQSGLLYPCTCSRQDVLRALQAPHPTEEEPIYPGTCRPEIPVPVSLKSADWGARPTMQAKRSLGCNWRFRVPAGETIQFPDGHYGQQQFVAGQDFGDFIVWRHDDVPAYQLAVVVDDALMQITEVVRGEDLLRSTARQLLLYRALHWAAPRFYHCPLVTDASGIRLAKRHDSLSLRKLRATGTSPADLRSGWQNSAEDL